MNKQIIAVDFHCKYQKMAWLDPPTGEIREADVRHESTQAVRDHYFSANGFRGLLAGQQQLASATEPGTSGTQLSPAVWS